MEPYFERQNLLKVTVSILRDVQRKEITQFFSGMLSWIVKSKSVHFLRGLWHEIFPHVPREMMQPSMFSRSRGIWTFVQTSHRRVFVDHQKITKHLWKFVIKSIKTVKRSHSQVHKLTAVCGTCRLKYFQLRILMAFIPLTLVGYEMIDSPVKGA